MLKRLLLLAAIALLGLAGCSKSADEYANTAILEVRLMDAPGDYLSVLLQVLQVEVHLKDEGDPDGWKRLDFAPHSVNLLQLVNGNSEVLANNGLAPGDLKEIRLILGPNSYVIGRDGQPYNLKMPSGQTSGVKLKLENVTLKPRETYQLLLDFDVAKSVVERGNWKPGDDKNERYLLKPVIRVVTQDLRAGLHGTVNPVSARPRVLAIRTSGLLAPDTVSTAADASGGFLLSSLAAGTYRVEFFPTTTAPAGQVYHNQVLTGITIVSDQVKELGTTSLN